MLKALIGLATAGVAALAIASPAAAAPVCNDDTIIAYVPRMEDYGSVGINAYDFCTGDNLVITEVYGISPSDWYYYSDSEISYWNVYNSIEYVSLTVSDGTGLAYFNITVQKAVWPH